MSKLFILGWDNALISDVVEHKIHPSYLKMLEVVDPLLFSKWTLQNTLQMQGLPPSQIWDDLTELLGKEKGALGRQIFYETYNQLPPPPLAENALRLLQCLKTYGFLVAIVSNKSQEILEAEICRLKVDGLIDTVIGTTADLQIKSTSADPNQKLKSRYCLLKQAIEEWPDAEEVTVVASSGYAEPAFRLQVNRFEEASAPVFDWIIGQLETDLETTAADPWVHELREDLLS